VSLDAVTEAHLARLPPGTVIAWFGDFVAAQRPQRLVQAVHVLSGWHVPGALVLMAGPALDPALARAVDRYTGELGLVGSWVAPGAAPALAAAFRRRADVIVVGPVPDRSPVELAVALEVALERARR